MSSCWSISRRGRPFARRDGAGGERALIRANRGFIAHVLRHDLGLIAVALLYVGGGRGDLRVTVSNGVFAAVVLLLLAAMQAEMLRRTAPDLRNLLVVPLRRETLLAIFYAAFALPGTVLVASLGFIVALAAGRGHAPATAGRVEDAVLGFLFMKSAVMNVVIAVRWHVILVGGYLLMLALAYFLATMLREFATPWIDLSGRAIVALLIGVNAAGTLGAMRELDL